MEVHRSVSGHSEQAASKQLSVAYAPEQSAAHVAVREVGFVLESLKSWALNYRTPVPEDTVVPDVHGQGDNAWSAGAYVYDEVTLEQALRHRFDTTRAEDRMTAGKLLAQLATAAAAHQEHLDQMDEYAQGELRAEVGSPRR